VYGLRAHSLNPDGTFSEVQIATTLYLLGRDAEAREWMDQGLMLKPDNVFIYSARTDYLMSLGQFGAAQDTIALALSRGIKRPELHVRNGLVAALEDRWGNARASFETATMLEPLRASGAAYSVWLRLKLGEAEAQPLARDLIAKSASSRFPPMLITAAGLETAIGRVEAATALLNKAVEYGYRDWRWLARHPMFDDLQDTEDFISLVERVQALVAAENSKANGS